MVRFHPALQNSLIVLTFSPFSAIISRCIKIISGSNCYLKESFSHFLHFDFAEKFVSDFLLSFLDEKSFTKPEGTPSTSSLRGESN